MTALFAKVLVLLGAIWAGVAPKFQDQAFGALDELSVKETAKGAQPNLGVAIIPATGTCAKPLKTTASSKKISKFSFLNNG